MNNNEPTEKKREQREQVALRESEIRFRALFDTMEQGVVYQDTEGRITMANPAAERILGLTSEQMQGRTSKDPRWQAIHEDGSPFPGEEHPSMVALRTGKPVSGVVMGVSHPPTEEYRWILIHAVPEFRPPETKPYQVYTTFTDITDRKRAEERIEHLNLTLRAIRNVNQLISQEKDRGRLLDRICNILVETRGYAGTWLVLTDESDKPLANAQAGWGEDFSIMLERWRAGIVPVCGQKALAQQNVVITEKTPANCRDCPLIYNSGNRSLTVRLAHAGKIYGLLSSCIPVAFVTDEEINLFLELAADCAFALHSIEAEEALRKSEAQLSNAMEIAKVGYWEYDLAEGVFIFNDHFYSIFHTSADQVGGYKMSPARYAELFLHPDDRHLVFDRTNEPPVDTEPRFSSQFDHRIIYADGGIGYISVRAFGMSDSEGRIVKVYGANQDITDRKRAEEALRESQERMAAIRKSISDVIMILDEEGRYLDILSGEEEILFREKEKVIGRLLRDVLPEDVAETGLATIRRALKTGKTQTIMYQLDVPAGERWFEGKISPILSVGDRGKLVVMVARDITERKKLEEEQQRIGKLESIGTLAGGIAHDFNNILTGIMGNISLAQRMVKQQDSEIAGRLEEAEKASIRARDLTHRLLTFARGGAPIKKIISIAELIRESVNFAVRGSNVKCEYSLPDDIWSVEADEGMLNQVFTNLVINAVEAMPMGGMLNISARNKAIEKTTTLLLNKGRYVEITVADQGTGISKAHLERIFEPYFTTKQRGSGLGLATTYYIVKNHDGYISVDSKLGFGTTFHIYLPASRKPAQVKREVSRELPVTGKGRILIMDDEEIIRQLLSKMLERVGYEVELARDGEETIRKYTAAVDAGKPFAAVIMDLTIPGGMGGKEAIKKLKEIDPEVKAIVSSGYSTDPIMSDYRAYGFSGVVAKPYQAGEIEKTLREILLGSN